ncbi:hypothetical protein CLU79DRAFT_778644 [Phycomyces nitens]|nr:hypothetical protein CLU79DRAFT_778644 [Phycomyces nitens]
MSDSTLSFNQRIQPFVLLAKSVKGIATGQLIMDCLAAPGVYVFEELYQSPNVIKAAALPEVAPYHSLLRVFLYGTYRDYVDNKANLPELSPAQLTKLKHLSIVSLSEKNKTLPYELLKLYLDIPTVRALEDLIIDAFYQNILQGKLDQRQQQLQVERAMGRDQEESQIEETLAILEAWSTRTGELLTEIDRTVQTVQEEMEKDQCEREQYDKQIAAVQRLVQNQRNLTIDDKGKEKTGITGNGRRDTGNEYDDYNYGSQDFSDRVGGRAKKR